ncbi:hypothetical protein CA54_41570 [Symmachiella macrocystis]|uniref:DUF3179 domain-containing protein n=1 Tax=Symmachiella macrocystis TaxID=2527985 RepID=A0A5C6BAB9_9PLAN|nr:DUF3179 domain-containing protein [Symmachiella macrocystis]TWU08918.1 hypothetical protein CA54_41570 [Symmachiella macrocystis]
MTNDQQERIERSDGRDGEGRVGKQPRAVVARRMWGVVEILLFALIVAVAWQIYSSIAVWNDDPKRNTAFLINGNEQARNSRIANIPFDLSHVTVPANEIRDGGPGKDGIPALSDPNFLEAADAYYLQGEDRVIGFVSGDEARAYPLKILMYHEIVNDRIGDVPLAVTYCPLCDSAMVFDRRTPLGERAFGVSGLLYNSNVLMYDRSDMAESLWSQLQTKGISGPASKLTLKTLPLELTTWQDWRSRHPMTKVLSTDGRYYGRDPYAGYYDRPQLMFPVQPMSDKLPTKARVLGVWTANTSRAYPESIFSKERTRIEEQIDGKKIVINFDPQSRSLRVVQADEGVQWLYSLWFAWYAFHPETSVVE